MPERATWNMCRLGTVHKGKVSYAAVSILSLHTTKRMKTRKAPASGGYLSSLVHALFAHLTSLLIFIVSLGPIPRHVAFVMDGNRRYARGKGQKVGQGHTEGFESLKRVGPMNLHNWVGLMSRYWRYV